MNLDIAIALCKKYEGFRSKPYLCPAGVPTMGYGTTHYGYGTPVTLSMLPITEEKATELLQVELAKTAAGVLRQCPILATDNAKFNAIVDFSYNLGLGKLQTSTLRRKINAQDWPGAQEQLLKWTRGGGKVLPGLLLRRKEESALLG